MLRSRIFFDIWFYFESADTRPGLVDIMEEFGEFFRFAPHAHFVAFVVSIAQLFDKRRDTITLATLSREMDKAGMLSSQSQSEVAALIGQADPLTILRHNAFAHHSASVSYNHIFKTASVTALEMRELTEISLKIANTLLRARGRQEHCFNDFPRDDAKALMNTLKKAMAR